MWCMDIMIHVLRIGRSLRRPAVHPPREAVHGLMRCGTTDAKVRGASQRWRRTVLLLLHRCQPVHESVRTVAHAGGFRSVRKRRRLAFWK